MRDKRVDHIGFVDELSKHFATPLREKVKAGLCVGDRVEGDYFFARVDPSTVNETRVSVQQVLKLYDEGKIKRPAFIKLIGGIDTKGLAELVDPKTYRKIVITSSKPGTPRMVISRLPDVACPLVAAVEGISAAVAPPLKAAA